MRYTVKTVAGKEYQIFRREDLTLADLAEVLLSANCVREGLSPIDMLLNLDEEVTKRLFDNGVVVHGLNDNLLEELEKKEAMKKQSKEVEPCSIGRGDILKCYTDKDEVMYLMVIKEPGLIGESIYKLIDIKTGNCFYPNHFMRSLKTILKDTLEVFKKVELLGTEVTDLKLTSTEVAVLKK